MIQVNINYWLPAVFDQNVDRGLALREMGDRVQSRYFWAAQTIEVLARDGWELRHFGNATYAQHKEARTEKEIKDRLIRIGIAPESLIISPTWQDFTKG